MILTFFLIDKQKGQDTPQKKKKKVKGLSYQLLRLIRKTIEIKKVGVGAGDKQLK